MSKKLQDLVKQFIEQLGEDSNREGLKETPERVNRMCAEIFKGYTMDPKDVFKVFDSDNYGGLVMVKDIEFYSFCEHHLIPFFGKIHIGYQPDKKIIGISKLGRLIEIFSHRLQLQERLTQQIRESLDTHLKSKGSAVIIEAKHLCMTMRGIKKPNATTITSSYSGVFKKPHAKKEFLNYIYHQ